MFWKSALLSLFVFLFVHSIFAQNDFYTQSWEKVDSLFNKKGLTLSALQVVTSIYNRAQKEKNQAQIIRSLIYRKDLQLSNDPNALNPRIAEIDSEIKKSAEPVISILRSIKAEMLWNFFSQNRFALYDRTPALQFNNDDIATWSMDDFHKNISWLYIASVSNSKLLQLTKLSTYDPILFKGNVRQLRPTLFDLLVHRALDYFKNDEIDLARPSYNFELQDEAVFADKSVFISHRFVAKDSLSNHFKALNLFQQLIQFHVNDPKPDALIDVDLERIEFSYQYATMDDKEALYMKALQNIGSEYGTLPAAAQAWYLQARIIADKASMYHPFSDTANRLAYVKAKEICDKIILSAGKNPTDSSEGLINAGNLIQDIQRKRLHLETEKVNEPGQPFRVLVTYRNINHFYYRIHRITPTQMDSIVSISYNTDYWEKIVQLNPVKIVEQVLPDTKDFQEHKVEIKIDGLEPGTYILLASGNTDFNLEGNTLAAQFFYISNLAYIENEQDFFVLNRETGLPIQGATVQVWYKYYGPRQRKQVSRRGEQFNTDKNGYFHLSPSKTKSNNSFSLEFTAGDDHLFMNDQNRYFGLNQSEYLDESKKDHRSYESEHMRSFFFLDRSIYRPGQTLYFKGIVVTRDFQSKQFKTLPSFKTKVVLYDADDQRIDSMLVTTNDFGSYHGRFTLPPNRLTGEFRIADDITNAEQGFSVEEYKRPKFNVVFDTLKVEYRLNDKIKLRGIAKSFAGNVINNANMKYRVMRMSGFPYPIYSRIAGPPMVTEIAHGESKTDQEGTFAIEFTALPDPSIRKENLPIFSYRVIADITDINGETRTGETIIQVGYHSLIVDLDLPDQSMPSDQFRNLSVRTQNLNGKFVSVPVQLSIYRLNPPDRLIRERYWERPDQFVMTKEDYIKFFPHDEYDNETSVESWSKKQKIVEFMDTTIPGKSFQWQDIHFSKGWYVVTAKTKDKSGDTVSQTKYIQLYDPQTGDPGVLQFNWYIQNFQTVEPGNYANTKIGSSAKDLFVIQTIDSAIDFIEPSYHFMNLSNERKTNSLYIGEPARGGLGVYYVFIKNNRVFRSSTLIKIPWTNKELKIQYETFREKTLPGGEENWKIKISGTKTNFISAEVLAGMYDASLDQFKPHSWMYPDLYPVYSHDENTWNKETNFSTLESFDHYREDYLRKYFVKNYDRLIQPRQLRYFGRRGISGAVTAKAPSPMPMALADSSGNNVVVRALSSLKIETESRDKEPEKSNNPWALTRKNFNETAYFFPSLMTDSADGISFSFTLPEALTQWRSMIFAYTKDLAMGYAEKSIVTQKSLMVQSNGPRFFREGDHLELNSKIVNMTDSEMTGQVHLQIIDPSTNQPVDSRFANSIPNQYFNIPPKQSAQISFPLEIPFQYNQPVSYRIIAQTPNLSDGEEYTLPVLPNRTLVTESIPISMYGPGKKIFRFDKLLESGKSESLSHYGLTFEYTSNPAWCAVQALPFLMEFPFECAEQTFNRFYANALATRIANSSTRIRQIFETWKNSDTAALQSALQKNEELKSIRLQETPWIFDAQDESKQKRNIGLLFSETRLKNELESTLSKLQNIQRSNGGFPWFPGGQDDRFITQYILTGIGRLRKMQAIPPGLQSKMNEIVKAAIIYVDARIKEDYEASKKRKAGTSTMVEFGEIQMNYLYMRSFFPDIPVMAASQNAVQYFRAQEKMYWLQQGKYAQGMIAITLFRAGDRQTAFDILASLKENSTVVQSEGMFWKAMTPGFYWYQAPIETQSLLIEAFQEISHDTKSVDQMKNWLLNQKQTQHWSSTKATADACYALLLHGSDLLQEDQNIEISAGNQTIINLATEKESGTGYVRKRIESSNIEPSMGNITVSATGKNSKSSWGAVYWQYFENLDKISSTKTRSMLSVSKKIFLQKNSDRGPVLILVEDKGNLKIGDKIIVRMEIRADRDLEYVHLKDMRASCFEPTNVLSGFKWHGNLGYYETTKDASTHFFISWLPRGTHVFEYSLFVSQAGNFSNGITTIQCMYAPGFSAHSESIRINAE